MGQIHIGVTCTGCRAQYAAAKRNDVPCDVGECKYSPSPGDTGPNGCGLLPQNEFAVWFYPRWKTFGSQAFEFVDIEMTPYDAECLMDKLMIIDEHAPAIAEAQQKRAEVSIPKKVRR